MTTDNDKYLIQVGQTPEGYRLYLASEDDQTVGHLHNERSRDRVKVLDHEDAENAYDRITDWDTTAKNEGCIVPLDEAIKHAIQQAVAEAEHGIPPRVVRENDGLGTSEAIAYYLCEHPDGPDLTQQAAGDLLGKARGTIKTQLQEARRKLDDGS